MPRAFRGVELKLRNGQSLIVGSRRPEELHETIQNGVSSILAGQQ